MTTATLTAPKTVHIEQTRKNILVTAHVNLPEYDIKAGETFLLRRVSHYTYIVKRISILSYAVHPEDVICQIETGECKGYNVTLRVNGKHTCDCAATGNCYHIDLTKIAWNAHVAARKAARKQQQPVIAAPTIPNAERGVLNGQRAFSVLRVA